MSRQVDWQQLYARLAASELSIETVLEPSPERIAYVYAERAARLAQPEADAGRRETEWVLTFLVQEERYSLELQYVAEVLPARAPSFVPGLPSYVTGVVSVRGETQPLVNLRALLGLEGQQAGEAKHIVLIGSRKGAMALQADYVEGVSQFAREDAQVIDTSRYITCRGAQTGMLLSTERLIEAITKDI